MNDIIKAIRKIVINSVNAQKLTDIMYGTVISVNPLKVQVDQKLILGKEHLKLTRAVKDYEVDMTINHTTETSNSHTHTITGKKKFKIHNGLVVGDKVTMIRTHGGQQYIIIDKE